MLLARSMDSGLLMASLPVLSVWPMMVTVVTGFWFRLVANWFRMGAKVELTSERPVANEMSEGMSSLRRLSAVWLTATPVPAVAFSMAAFWSCMRLDQR